MKEVSILPGKNLNPGKGKTITKVLKAKKQVLVARNGSQREELKSAVGVGLEFLGFGEFGIKKFQSCSKVTALEMWKPKCETASNFSCVLYLSCSDFGACVHSHQGYESLESPNKSYFLP